MSSINEALSLLSSVLLNPKDQRPTIDQRFTQLTWEFSALYSELENTNLPWSTNSVTVNVNDNQPDYLVPVSAGRVLFAFANTNQDAFGPIGLEFADLASVSSDFYLYSPLDYGYSRDFNEVFNGAYAPDFALYRQDGNLKFKLRPMYSAINSVTLVFSSGNWLENLSVESTAVLPQYHQLVITRAALNLLPGCEWSGTREENLQQRQQLAMSLNAQMLRYQQNFMYAKRQMSADQDTDRYAALGDW